jgi:hypothetical protein
LCSDIILRLGIFARKLGRKTWNLGGKNGIWQNFVRNIFLHWTTWQDHARPYKIYQTRRVFLGLGIYAGNRKKKTPTGWLDTFFCRAEFVGMFLVTPAIGIYSGMALFGSTSRH